MIPSLMPTYARSEYAFDRGEGVYLFDLQGKKYLDFAAGIAVSSLGHSHPHLVGTLVAQGQKLWHVSNLYRIPEAERLADRLVANSFADTVFFGNSGTEAGELAVKLARKYHDDRGQPDRFRIVTIKGAFHGRTLAMIAAGGNEKHLKGFDPPVEGFDHIAADDVDGLERAITPQTAAIMLEPIQGEGGIRPLSETFLRAARNLADQHGLLLIFDEVQCGLGRTGKLWAHQWSGVLPDVMMVAKGLGGGFPIGAVLATEAASRCMAVGTHGSTYGGNPLACAIGNAVLDVVLEPGFLDAVTEAGTFLQDGLRQIVARYPKILQGVRGVGLMQGLQCVVSNTDMLGALRRQGLLTVSASDNVIRLVPPLIARREALEEALQKIDAACEGWQD